MVLLNVNTEEVGFETTIFPDGTSQVWKINPHFVFDEGGENEVVIVWHFENEGELMHVMQLSMLAQKYFKVHDVTLRVPYLPYGRQDKEVSNTLSFALETFKNILYHAGNITRIETFDPHSKTDMVHHDEFHGFKTVKQFHDSIMNHDIVCFPDGGAQTRYASSFLWKPMISCEKIRNQLTGEITGLSVHNPLGHELRNKKILIVDDICDGGMTFIKVAQALKESNPNQIDLAVSHGIFSKGKQCLHDAGIANIYTTNSLLRNKGSFGVLLNYD